MAENIRQVCKQKSSHMQIIDIMKGICAIWVIMLHSIPGGGIYKLLLMPFTAQLTIPFFMTITGFTYASSYDRCGRWWSSSNLKRKWKRILIPVIPVLLFELLVCGMPDNPIIWLLSGGYQMPGSYYVILLIQLLFLFPVIKRFAHIYAGTSNSGAHTWWTGFIMVFIFQCAYELVTYVISLDVAIYRLLVFRYIIFIYGGAMIYEYHKVSPDMIPYKGMFKGLPIGLLFITAAGLFGIHAFCFIQVSYMVQIFCSCCFLYSTDYSIWDMSC